MSQQRQYSLGRHTDKHLTNAPTSCPFLQVCDVIVKAGKFRVDVQDFSAAKGSCVAIIGSTGSRKTIFLEAIVGFQKTIKEAITYGTVRFDVLPPEDRHNGFAYQDSLLFPHLNVLQNVMFGARDHQPKTLQLALTLLADFDFGISKLAARRISNLSGGERQRVCLARTLLPSA